jgi:signal transduction histidine kinase
LTRDSTIIELDAKFCIKSVENGDLIPWQPASLQVGHPISEALPNLWQHVLRYECEATLEKGKSSVHTVPVQFDEQHSGWLELHFSPCVKHRQIDGVKLQIFDITLSSSKQRNGLVHKMQTLAELAAHIVHTFNSPMAAMLNQVGCLLMEDWTEQDIPRLRKELEELQEEIYTLSLITNALESFSPHNRDDFTLVNINEIVEKSVELSKLLNTHDDVSIEMNLHPRVPFIKGNEIILEQALINFLKNSLESMTQGGCLKVCTLEDKYYPQYVRIDIKDQGKGIPTGNLAKIFEPFFTTKGRGFIGLGLTVSYGIIANHDGDILVNSEVKKGTTVSIYLPKSEK